MTCPICSWKSDNIEYLFLYETEHWRACLAPNQCLIGRSVIYLKRHKGDLANLTSTEMLDFLALVRRHETLLKRAFAATMFNWSCYMNISYRQNPPDPHVHWWAVPRYDHPVKMAGMTFTDPDFGSPYPHNRWQEIPVENRIEIVNKITEAMTV